MTPLRHFNVMGPDLLGPYSSDALVIGEHDVILSDELLSYLNVENDELLLAIEQAIYEHRHRPFPGDNRALGNYPRGCYAGLAGAALDAMRAVLFGGDQA